MKSKSPIRTIWQKELKDTVRDRKTFLSMVVMPLVLMPVLLVGISRFSTWQAKQAENNTTKIIVSDQGEAESLTTFLDNQDNLEVIKTETDPKTAVKEEEADLALVIPTPLATALNQQQPVPITLLQKSTSTKAPISASRLATALVIFNQQLKQERFVAAGINPQILNEVSLVPQDVTSPEEMAGFVLGFILPMFIVMWAIVGGQYTAIDVSAGEKERKTLEALLLAPVRRIQIVWGKFLAVATVSAVSVILSITSMYFALNYMGVNGGLGSLNTGAPTTAASANLSFTLELPAVVLMVVVGLLLVALFSAVILAIAIYANSFKEAQSYISPAYLVVILPVVAINSLPNFQPDWWFFTLPAMNGVALFKEALLGTFIPSHIALTIVSLVLYSILAIIIATRIYQKENVLFRT